MKIEISIKSYKRREMLVALIQEIENYSIKNRQHQINYHITDDSSGFDKDFIEKYNITETPKNFGKEEHWKMWDMDLKRLKSKFDSDMIIFLASDNLHVNFDEIINYGKTFIRNDFAFFLINDGRTKCWNNIPMRKINNKFYQVGFTDCSFFTNYRTLNKIGFYVNPIHKTRFIHNKLLSSGVGHQLTNRLNEKNINIFMPHDSLCYHGYHESLMNPEARKQVPLVSLNHPELKKQENND